MIYEVWKLSFENGVHIGEGGLTESHYTMRADTFFSAICQEIIKQNEVEVLDKFVENVGKGNLKFSDGFPFVGEQYYLPKPLISVQFPEEDFMKYRKKLKNLKFINSEQYIDYIDGKTDITSLENPNIGKNELRIQNSINSGEATPYNVGVYHFNKNAGIYFIVGHHKEETYATFVHIMEGLGLTGIGGKRSSGLGSFEARMKQNIPSINNLFSEENAQSYISLTTGFPKEDEIDVIDNANYQLIRRGGFVSSENYSDSFVRKREFYSFSAGSAFCKTFEGDIFDVSRNGSHPVYRYGKPIFVGVKNELSKEL